MPQSFSKRNTKLLLAAIILMALGIYTVISSCWALVQTASYVRQASPIIAVVEDVRQRPFESAAEALQTGNFTLTGGMAYQPIISYSNAEGDRIRTSLPDLNDQDYVIQSGLEILLPNDPSLRPRENRAAALWAPSAVGLLTGVIIVWLGSLLLRRRKRPAPQGTTQPHSEQRRAATPARRTTPPQRKRSPRRAAHKPVESKAHEVKEPKKRRKSTASAPGEPQPGKAVRKRAGNTR